MTPDKPLHVRVAEALGWTAFPYMLATVNWWEQPCVPPGERAHISTVAPIPRYDTDWSSTGPLIERYKIASAPHPRTPGRWEAWQGPGDMRPPECARWGGGETLLVAVCNLLILAADELQRVGD